MGGARAVFLSLLLVVSVLVSAPVSAAFFSGQTEPAESSILGSIAGWLQRDGREGWLGADVADTVGIPRLATEEMLAAKQRGFRDDEALRVAQVSGDERREFLLFMVQRFDGQVFFYLAGVREGLKAAYVSSGGLVAPLERIEAEASFHRELRFWESRVAMR
ncbi:MAG TPA: hypothetical protein VF110_05615 [Burkholderiales bacterium]